MAENSAITNQNPGLHPTDPVFQNLLSGALESQGDPYSTTGGVLMQMTGMVGDPRRESFHGSTAFRYAINEVSFPKKTGQVTIFKHNPNPPGVMPGDAPQNADDVGEQHYAEFSFSPVMYKTKKGFGIEDDFQGGLMPFGLMMAKFLDMNEQVRNWECEFCMGVMAGRLGQSGKLGWVSYQGNEGDYNANQGTQIASHPDWKNVKTGTNYKLEPTEILSPATPDLNFYKTPRVDRATIADTHTMTPEFVERVQRYLATRMGWNDRGLAFEPSRLFGIQKSGQMTGMYTRMPDSDMSWAMWLNPYQLSSLRQSDKWEQYQNNLTQRLGTKSGITTGQVGDFYGVRLFEMPKSVIYEGAANVQIARGFILGKGAMLKIAPRYSPVGDNVGMYQSPNRKWTKKFKNAGNLYEFITATQGVGWTAGLFWKTYLSFAQIFWPMAKPGSKLAEANGGRISGVMAVDTALQAEAQAY